MTHSHRRHDISDRVSALLETHSSGRQAVWGGIARDSRQFINISFYELKTTAQLPRQRDNRLK
ncbi:hypothetical protein SAMN05216419_102830 [Nitrosomonas cryotolerans]|uniref:Uncharacterized protein n=1 Tax=Nitrosomonas cryotolerans ATCC 49181 TaxID=1131553 RepID=A0A1N6GD55_9PROT|nr:hypothetical protein SAMN05216419_102830 [Nitrosomonas cryotolerans]SIO05431.1 hypothetical protein SAMN02743940_0655 [Nitrosomonas cryotolerans ATCC 49181]